MKVYSLASFPHYQGSLIVLYIQMREPNASAQIDDYQSIIYEYMEGHLLIVIYSFLSYYKKLLERQAVCAIGLVFSCTA